MRKLYFGKDREHGYPLALYVVKLLDSELEKFTAHMREWNFEKYQYIPEIVDCKKNETAICYDIEDSEEKETFEEAYMEYKKGRKP